MICYAMLYYTIYNNNDILTQSISRIHLKTLSFWLRRINFRHGTGVLVHSPYYVYSSWLIYRLLLLPLVLCLTSSSSCLRARLISTLSLFYVALFIVMGRYKLKTSSMPFEISIFILIFVRVVIYKT